jgi:thiamine biosynthesis lipoprotein
MATSELGVMRSDPMPRMHAEQEVMGTVVTFDVFDDAGVAPAVVRAHLEEAQDVLRRADRVFSTWRETSPISRLRRGELTLQEMPAEVIDVLASCMVARNASAGWFDPWSMPGGVDPTGYVKGWATQRALQALARSGIRSAMVNAAGDIASIGDLGPSSPFHVGISNPSSPRELACVISLRGAIATSGAYERGAHLIDPHTRRAQTAVASASVCGPDLGLADALATALCVGGDEVLSRIESLADYEALAIGFDGRRSMTSQFPLVDP